MKEKYKFKAGDKVMAHLTIGIIKSIRNGIAFIEATERCSFFCKSKHKPAKVYMKIPVACGELRLV